MIELRFVKRSIPAPELGENIDKPGKVLQQRRLICDHYLRTAHWSEWEDVPLVEEVED